MPIIFSYDLVDAAPIQLNHLRSQFERFGWENIGGSCYRYPRLNNPQHPEDWLNGVIPALMCFRSYIRKNDIGLSKYSLDTHVSTGSHGDQPRTGARIVFAAPTVAQFGEQNLRDWLDATTDAIPY